ncbi:ABC-type transport system permease protein (probable substrate branched-chain amino acids) [Haladaptatus paucihalophilus DX253]|uniref:ABC-type transport system permease protein (Probable substrate branched-chain amino acids) n=2 Tax=Haladaptatus paucihalophilus TaxID=367189 RepID=E7QQ15_HALPU|nr:branched-chain amino acid ABC transporter permease [Haladaptatus paucihalophilus]EFW93079.1 ABC-type transport system permease protein (probable substrate branched-chain amino acids) [Haladaptatus paucihalophilus DX253]SHK44035.1 amino acid/amide ABC transporter membrane protein 1, HAAT family [Haladaptatus paucihalophilus DX253]
MNGVNETYSRGRRLIVERPLLVVVGLVGVLLVFDFINRLLSGDLLVSDVGSLVWNGLMRGLIIGLAGIGLSMTYSILNFANFSHGDYITSGAFSGWAVTYLIAGLGSNNIAGLLLVGAGGSVYASSLGITIATTPIAVVLGLVFAGVSTVVLALLIDRIVYRPMRDAEGISLLITSVGVAFVLRYLIVFVFSTENRGTTALQDIPKWNLLLWDGTVRVTAHDLTLLVCTVGLMIGVHLLLQRTKLGKAMRAMADNEDLARISGIPTERVIRWTWIIGGGLTGIAGYLLVLWKGTIVFQFGWLLLLPIFAAVILGGIGSIYGAILGGLVIGLTWNLSIIWIPSAFGRAAAFGMMILILLFKPQGLFAGRTTA